MVLVRESTAKGREDQMQGCCSCLLEVNVGPCILLSLRQRAVETPRVVAAGAGVVCISCTFAIPYAPHKHLPDRRRA